MAENDDWKRHAELYMSDGTIVLLAESTLFRVYAGLLATQSLVFKGLTESSQHLPDDAESYDGCPLVKLQDDNPEEVAYFLKATMGDQPVSYPMASAILRLSSKYMVQSLRRQAIKHFCRIIPQSYNEIGKKESPEKIFGSDRLGWPHPFQLLSLVRECQLKIFLPWRYYAVCARGFDKIVRGETMFNGKEIRLDESDTCIALLGWNSLCTTTRKIRIDAILSSAKDCQGGSCNNAMRLAWMKRAALYVGSEALHQWEMFTYLAQGEFSSPNEVAKDFVIRYGRPCHGCTKAWLRKEECARAAIWSKLPSIFDLPDWEMLKLQEEP
ncbi:hypothetical protein Clacol_004199 [Clathrus columnatus]|uniref:BTB domain-containing protein n=1 Tax=Clathrus columnatus TaxID=1419009 RepID=A0AAV5A5T1_9AGAM|nr:hypothetical protein Clacol_004199 [Clathrus columnatus]